MLLGNVYTAGGDFAAARPLYTAAMKAARATQNRKLESDMMTNLGMVEARIGDPMRAIVWYRQAIALERLNGEAAELLPNMDNMAQLSLQLGHLEEARSTVEAALAIAERGNMGSELPWQREHEGFWRDRWGATNRP